MCVHNGNGILSLIYFKKILSSKILIKKTYYYGSSLRKFQIYIYIAFKRKIYFWACTYIFNLGLKFYSSWIMQTRVKETIHKKSDKINTNKFINMWSVIPCAFAGYYLVLRLLIEEKIRSNKVHRCKRNILVLIIEGKKQNNNTKVSWWKNLLEIIC